jgi:hypothetical protein
LRDLIVGDEVPCDGFAVVGGEELGGCVPELPCLVGLDQVELVFELRIFLAELSIEFGLVCEVGEVERFARREDDDLFREVPVGGVV